MDTFTVTGGGLNIIGYGLFIGLTWAFFQHMGSGIRHLLMDMGAGYELRTSARSAWAAYVFAPIATVFVWAYIVLR
jgi:succinate dehydrogenase / fumarate reductase cytochrome b subunit